MKKLTKEQVYVVIDNQADCDRSIDILTKANEPMWKDKTAFLFDEISMYLCFYDDEWFIDHFHDGRIKITIDGLEQLLTPKIKKSELQNRIEVLEKKVADLEEPQRMTVEQRDELAKPFNPDEYKIGTIGLFWDGDFEDAMKKNSVLFGELDHITENGHFRPKGRSWSWDNFKPIKFD